MKFVVYEDEKNASDTKIHVADCSYYINRKRNAKSTKWYGPYDTYNSARKTAKKIAKDKSSPFRNSKDPKCCKLLSKTKRGKVRESA